MTVQELVCFVFCLWFVLIKYWLGWALAVYLQAEPRSDPSWSAVQQVCVPLPGQCWQLGRAGQIIRTVHTTPPSLSHIVAQHHCRPVFQPPTQQHTIGIGKKLNNLVLTKTSVSTSHTVKVIFFNCINWQNFYCAMHLFWFRNRTEGVFSCPMIHDFHK